MIAHRVTIRAADLFCGAGGSSTGALAACHDLGFQLDLTAINHWPVAVETHTANHGGATHFCEDLGAIDPLKAVPGGHLHLLVASPECTHHSNARGGRPMQDQSRASAWHITRWAAALRIDNVLIENVPEFRHWGPLDEKGRPLKSKRGATFRAFLQAIRSLGYRVDWAILNAADYGDATTRKRLFIIARRGSRKIHWPEPTHAPREETDLLGSRLRWRAAREIIDWSVPGKSIFARKKPLSTNTMRRIIAGLKRFGGPALEPFIVMLNSTTESHTERSSRSAEEPFLIGQQTDAMPRPVSEPAPTVATAGAIALVEPFVVGAGGAEYAGNPATVEKPLGTVLTKDSRALVQPFVISTGGPNCEANRGETALVAPFVVQTDQTGSNGGCIRSADDPLGTVISKQHAALVQPVIRTADGQTLALDIHFRMLQPHELAGAMSFPADYKFAGNREQQVKQIGNAVPVHLSKALIHALLVGRVAEVLFAERTKEAR